MQNKTKAAITSEIHLLILFSFFMVSCGTPKLLKEHLETDNINLLINDYHELKPKYRTMITQHIFGQHDFSKDSYGTLVNYRDKSNDILLTESFDSVVSIREDQILEHLDNCGDVNSVAEYYKSHSDEQSFLDPVVSATLTQNIEDYGYIDVRTMYRAFKGTNICDSIYPYYQEKRATALPAAKAIVQDYCKNELKLLEVYRQDGRKKMPEIANQTYEVVIDKLLEEDFPEGKSNLTALYGRITEVNNPAPKVQAHINQLMQDLRNDMNECRENLVVQLTGYSEWGAWRVPELTADVKKMSVKCPIGDMMTISSIQNRRSTSSTLLSLASFIPGAIGLLATAADIYKSYKDSKEKANELTPYIKSMAMTINKNLKNTCNKEYDTALKSLKKNIEHSQNKLNKYIDEKY